jgi:hypothetical protein
MTVNSLSKKEDAHLVCLEPPKSNKIPLNGLKRPIMVFTLIIIFILPFFPGSEESEVVSPLFSPRLPEVSEVSEVIPSRVIVHDTIETADNGYVILCEEYSFDQSGSLMLFKTDHEGELQWSRNYGIRDINQQVIQSITQLSDGGFVIAGWYDGIDVNSERTASIGYSEYWIIRTDEWGIIQWNNTYARDTLRRIEVSFLISTPDGGFLLGGCQNNWESITDYSSNRNVRAIVFLVKYGSNGEIHWNKTLMTDSSCRNNEELVMVQSTIGGYVYAIAQGGKITLGKINNNGTTQWAHILGEPSYEFVNPFLQPSPDGGVFITYRTFEWIEVSPGDFHHVTLLGIANISSSGKLSWNQHYDLEYLLEQEGFHYSSSFTTISTVNGFTFGNAEWDGDLKSQLATMDYEGNVKKSVLINDIELTHFIKTSDGGYLISGNNYLVTDNSTAILMKYDDSLNYLWSHEYLIPADDEWSTDVVHTQSGDLVLVGNTNSIGNGRLDGFLTTFQETDNITILQTYGGEGEDGIYSFIQTNDLGFALGGFTDSYGTGGYDMWLIKTDAKGIPQWNQTYGGQGDEWCETVIQTNDGGFLLIGGYYIIKTDVNGNFEWNQSLYMCGSSVLQTEDGGFLLGGTNPKRDFGFTIQLMKITSQGILEWNHSYVNTQTYNDNYISVEGLLQVNGDYALLGMDFLSCGDDYCHAGEIIPFFMRTDSQGTLLYNQSYSSCNWWDDHGGLGYDYSTTWKRFPQLTCGSTYAFSSSQDGGFFFGVGSWLIKTDSTGLLEWNLTYQASETFSSPTILSITHPSKGRFVLAGYITTITPVDGVSRDIWYSVIDLDRNLETHRILGFETGNISLKVFSNSLINEVTALQASEISPVPGFQFLFCLVTLIEILAAVRMRKKIVIHSKNK